MVAAEPVAFFSADWVKSICIIFISKNEVKTIPFCSQPAARRPCQGAAEIPRQLIKSQSLATKVYLATDVSFCALLTALICYDFAAPY